MRTSSLVAAIGILLALVFAGYFAAEGIQLEWADGTMSLHGWIALGLSAVGVLAIGGGLMWLVFFSARRGYDERAHHRDLDDLF